MDLFAKRINVSFFDRGNEDSIAMGFSLPAFLRIIQDFLLCTVLQPCVKRFLFVNIRLIKNRNNGLVKCV